uniref:Uncharacterized protein n=1 Tax=Nothobranchius furzeri TaxID=105023 RepID=A0A8C6P265_NOTFU
MLRTHSSSFAMSVSSSQGLTSSRMEDLAISGDFLDFLAAYSRRRCSRTLAASTLSSSSSEPKRSISSSLLLPGICANQVANVGLAIQLPLNLHFPMAQAPTSLTS